MKLRTIYLILFAAILVTVCAVMVSSFSNIAVHTSAEIAVSKPTIIIDAGHGGEDGGATVDGVSEKDVNLQIARRLADMLRLSGYEVIEVRTEDISVYSGDAETLREKKVSDLKNRVALFNGSNNQIVVSVHQNKFENSVYHGTQVFYSVNHPDSKTLAEKIRNAVVLLLQNDNTRELKPAGKDIYILNNTTVPAVIVECGFLSNPEEMHKLLDDVYQQELAFAAAMGIIDYQES